MNSNSFWEQKLFVSTRSKIYLLIILGIIFIALALLVWANQTGKISLWAANNAVSSNGLTVTPTCSAITQSNKLTWFYPSMTAKTCSVYISTASGSYSLIKANLTSKTGSYSLVNNQGVSITYSYKYKVVCGPATLGPVTPYKCPGSTPSPTPTTSACVPGCTIGQQPTCQGNSLCSCAQNRCLADNSRCVGSCPALLCSPCSAGQTCQNGACTGGTTPTPTSCTNACSSGESKCGGNTRYVCEKNNDTGCYIWSAMIPSCASGTTCQVVSGTAQCISGISPTSTTITPTPNPTYTTSTVQAGEISLKSVSATCTANNTQSVSLEWAITKQQVTTLPAVFYLQKWAEKNATGQPDFVAPAILHDPTATKATIPNQDKVANERWRVLYSTDSGLPYAFSNELTLSSCSEPTPTPTPTPTSTVSPTSTSTTTPTPAISTPSNTSGEAIDDGSIKLSWNSVSGAKNYEIYDCNNKLVTSTTDTSIILAGLNCSTEYCYQIKALDSLGNRSNASDKITTKTKDCSTAGSTTDAIAKISSLVSTGASIWFNILIALILTLGIGYFMFRKNIWR